ncbi:STE3-domain-containing protein [Hysterangium stoloniferum]|nr:STE3-domain-containing protein [Hysterangium stoloniferum]
MRHPEFPILSFVSAALALICLPSHVRARSVSTLALIGWLSVANIAKGINSIIWANNVVIRDQVWCDIVTKIFAGLTIAVPAAAMCILRHLEHIASARHVMTTRDDRRRRQIFEAVMCFGLPILLMALHYIVQGHRFDIFEDIGCMPTVYFSWAALFLIYLPPLVLSSFSLVLAIMTLRHFLRHRINFATHLRNSQSGMSPNRYFRLMALSIVTVCWDTSINSWVIWANVSLGFRPWISWADVHSHFSRILQFPTFLIPARNLKIFIFQWYLLPISALLFFVFFGFGGESQSDFKAAFNWFRRTILRQKVQEPSTFAGLPTYRFVVVYDLFLVLHPAKFRSTLALAPQMLALDCPPSQATTTKNRWIGMLSPSRCQSPQNMSCLEMVLVRAAPTLKW